MEIGLVPAGRALVDCSPEFKDAQDGFLCWGCSSLCQGHFLFPARGSLQPWSQGVIAVVVFLVLVAIAFVVNRFWCKDKVESAENVVSVEDKPDAVTSNGHEGRYISAAADFRSKENQHAYENTVEPEEKVITTAM